MLDSLYGCRASSVEGKCFDGSASTVPARHTPYVAEETSSPTKTEDNSELLLQQEFEHMLKSARVGMSMIDADLRYTWVNETFAAMLRFEPSELVGKSVLDVTHPDDVGLHAELAMQVYKRELDNFTFRKRFLAKDGTVVSCDVLATASFDDDGTPLAGIGFQMNAQATDPTARRIESLQREAVVGQFTAAGVHDIRNSLSALSVVADTLASSNTVDLDHAARLLRSELDAALSLLQSISTFARPDVPAQNAAETVASLGRLIDQATPLLRLVAAETRLTIDVSDASARPGISPREFQQVMLNLMLNARDAVAEHGRSISVVAGKSADREGAVDIHVIDDGVGMSPTDIGRVFTPYFTTKGENGTGLGLSICREIVERYSGELLVESTEGEGSRFTVRLPITALPD